jgi:hypothetical protein
MQSDNRAKGTIFSHSQKGFIPRLSGCTQHITVATMAINQALMRTENLFILDIDLKDAFGSVSHKLLEHNLLKLGMSNNITGMIMDSYEEATVQLTSKNGYTGDINIKRGVKQGCPLSPILFNACIDPLIKRLNLEMYKQFGFSIDPDNPNNNLTVQAYADDILLFSTSKVGLEFMIECLSEFLNLVR